jgi:DNA-binding XRE family transcriptional regulator
MKKSKTKSKSIDTLTDELVGKRGTQKREKFEYELRMDILGTMIKEARIRKKLSQEQLGALIGVQKAQVSKIENHTKSNRIDTIIRVLNALDMKVRLSVEYDKKEELVLV